MAFTLGVHIILACFGVAFPAIVLIANWKGIRGDADALLLARRWSKVMAVLFAVGAVTGTVLSFELGLLWPGLMGRYGDVFGIPFAFEAIFFFTEAIFIAIYLYGWKRLPPKKHFLTGIPIVLAGAGGTFSIVSANGWMNHPSGFTELPDGSIVDIQPLAAIFNEGVWHQVPHMYLAAYIVAGCCVASVYAVGMLKGRRDRYHTLGFCIPFTVAAIALPLQFFVGDQAARAVYDKQPVKFAAMELVWETGPNQPEVIGGIMDPETGEISWGIQIPDVASILSGFSPDTVIEGLADVPPEDRPPANIVHLAFDVMIFAGSALLAMAAWYGFVWWRRRRLPKTRWFLRATATSGVLAVIALEAGWIVTEVGRQPWVVYGHLRTEDAVTDAGGLWWWFALAVAIYVVVITAGIVVIRTMAKRWQAADAAAAEAGLAADTIDPHAPYAPRPRGRADTGADAERGDR
ncbi:MAG: cytochrome ubiquinol oxidase subunit I [Acidimicrobiia bacterium]|nr:cytochrome ubiquinol oxidase subunit I [Acidimicrobiia bacterium]